MSELAKALLRFHEVPPEIRKDATGQIGSRTYRDADLEAVLRAVRPRLQECGLVVTQSVGQMNGHRSLTTQLIHAESGESQADTLVLPDTEDMQVLGSQITYARRYSLLAMLGLVADEDDDGAAASPGPTAAAVPSSDPLQPLREELNDTLRKLDKQRKDEVTAAGFKGEAHAYMAEKGWELPLDAAQLTEMQQWFGSFLRPARAYGPRATKEQHQALALLVKRLEETQPGHPDGGSWEDASRAYAERKYGVKSRSQLTVPEMTAVIGHFNDLAGGPL